MNALMLATLWWGCASEAPPGEALEVSEIQVRVFLEGAPRSGGGKLVVQTEYDARGEVRVPELQAEGLEFELDGPPTAETIGDRDVVTQRYVYRGSDGHYEIPPLTASWTSPDGTVVEGSSTPVFLDVAVEPLRVGELSDIVEPNALWTIPWVPVLSVGAIFVAGLAMAFWPRREEEATPERRLPPHMAALKAWEAIRFDGALTDEDKARELSVIFRTYLEGALRFEASAWTTTEILAHLRSLVQLPEGNVPRAKRLLRATDRIKFAEERPSGELIEELDADLRAFVDATRPTSWQASEEESQAVAPAPARSASGWALTVLMVSLGAAVGMAAIEVAAMALGIADGVLHWAARLSLVALAAAAASILRVRR
ncbi:MAG: hypothetical protein KTR31_14095 [Myxococcales bacterium]|nr:hypothetical protein [Myxococcales bacterium]